MGYDRYDRDSWRGQSSGGYGRDRDYGQRDYGQGRASGSDRDGSRDRDYGRQPQGYDYDQRGFFDRAGDEVRSWFGDEDAERRRRMDERYDDRQDPRGSSGYGSRGDYGRGDYGRGDYGRQGGGYGRDEGRSFGGGGQSGYGSSSYGGRDQGGQSRGSGGGSYGYDRSRAHDDDRRYGQGSVSNYGERDLSRENRHDHDPSYRSWRDRQMESFDRDYADYRRENQSRFDSEFSQWRTQREGQRRHLSTVREHQEVVGSDGQHVGTVDHVQGDQIKLTRTDQNAGGQHHFIPCSWIDSVDDKVKISKTAAEARQHWTDEARNSGSSFFGRNDGDRAQGGRTQDSTAGTSASASSTGSATGATQGSSRS